MDIFAPVVAAILATRYTPSVQGLWLTLAVAVPSALAVVFWVGVASKRWPVATFAPAFFFTFGFSAIWPGSPIFETWYQGRNLPGAAELVTGVVLLAAGVGLAASAVGSRARAARALGFAFGVAFVGFVTYWFVAMALGVVNVDRRIFSPMSVVMLSFLGHPAGWLIAYAGLRRVRYRGPDPDDDSIAGHDLPDNLWRPAVVGSLLGLIAAAGLAGVWLNVVHYEVLNTGRRNWTASGWAYVVQMQLETLILFALPLVMCLTARCGAREQIAIPGRCQGCGYDLRGHLQLASPVCPECGTPYKNLNAPTGRP